MASLGIAGSRISKAGFLAIYPYKHKLLQLVVVLRT